MRSERARHNKIIFSGTVGAGKSTAINALSDIPPVSTEALASDDTAKLKKTTTVAMDYGVLNLPDGEKVMLYGTPGQERFSFMWDILSEGGIGLVLLINNANTDPLSDLKGYLGAFKDFIAGTAVTVGVTHMKPQAMPRNSKKPMIGLPAMKEKPDFTPSVAPSTVGIIDRASSP